MAVMHSAALRLLTLLCVLPVLRSAAAASLEQELLSLAKEHLDYMIEARRCGAIQSPSHPACDYNLWLPGAATPFQQHTFSRQHHTGVLFSLFTR